MKINSKHHLAAAVGCAVLAGAAMPAGAAVVTGWAVNSACDCLLSLEIDPGAGTATTTPIGVALDPVINPGDNLSAPPAGNRFATPVALAVRGSDDAVFGVNNSFFAPGAVNPNSTSRQQLFSVDTTTGHGTIVDPLDRDAPALGEIDFAPDGVLYSFGDGLRTVSLTDGQPGAAIALTDAGTGGVLDIGLGAFAPDGTLYGFSFDDLSLYDIDLASGQGTRLGDIDAAVASLMQDLAWDPVNDLLWGSDLDGVFQVGLVADASGRLAISNRIDGVNVQGFGFGILPAQSAPEPVSGAMLGVGLAVLAAARRRRTARAG